MRKLLSWNENDSDESKDSKEPKDSKTNRPWNNDSKDPWGKNRKTPNDGLPDLDEMFKQGVNWLKSMLGGKKSGGGFDNRGSSANAPASVFLSLISIFIIVIIGIVGFYKVEPGEQAVKYRFGKYIGMEGPGPHWLLPFIYSKEIHNTSVVHRVDFEDDLITKEVNIISVQLAVQYKISDIEKYLFKVRSPEESLAEATKAAIRQVIAESTLEQVLSTQGKSDETYMGAQIKSEISKNLELYEAGLDVQGVRIRAVVPPQQVKAAFNDAIQAQEDEERYRNQADAYVSKVVPVAEGQAARIIQDANAYASQTVLAAEGGVARFQAVLPEYKRAPDVTRNRMYIATMENALKNTPKILVDTKSNNVLFLPLDKLNNMIGQKASDANQLKSDAVSSDAVAVEAGLSNIYKPTATQSSANGSERSVPSRTWRD